MPKLHREIPEEISDPRCALYGPPLSLDFFHSPPMSSHPKGDLEPQDAAPEIISLSVIADTSIHGVVLRPHTIERSPDACDGFRTDTRGPGDVLGCGQASTSSAQ
jgi:hypothetical protein